MSSIKNIGFAAAAAAFMITACGQDDIVWPDAGQSPTDDCGECDPQYPAGPYKLETDEVIQCLEWESARVNETDTVISLEDEYLSALNDAENDNRAIVIVVSAQGCAPCANLITSIASKAEEFENAGAFFMAAAYTNLLNTEVKLDLETAEDVLLEDDGWPVQWPLCNDEENQLRSLGAEFPLLVVVSMNDMVIRTIGSGTFGAGNGYPDVDSLLSTVQSFPDVTPAAEE